MADIPIDFDPSVLLEPIAEVVGPIISGISVILGGVFGIYLLLLLVRIYFEHRKIRLLKEIRDDIRSLKTNPFHQHVSSEPTTSPEKKEENINENKRKKRRIQKS